VFFEDINSKEDMITFIAILLALILFTVWGISSRLREFGIFFDSWRQDWEKANNINQDDDLLS